MTAKELYKIDFTEGLNQGVETSASPVVSILDNFVVEKKGGLRKRPGVEPVTSIYGTTSAISRPELEPEGSSTVESTQHITSYNDSIVRIGSSKLYSDGFVYRGMVSNMTGYYDTIASSTHSLVEPHSITVTNSYGQTVRVVLYRSEVVNEVYDASRYTDQYRDYSTYQNVSSNWTKKNNLSRLFYSVYVDDVLLIDKMHLLATDSIPAFYDLPYYYGAQLVEAGSFIVCTYAINVTESFGGSGFDAAATTNEMSWASANNIACRVLPIDDPGSGFSNQTTLNTIIPNQSGNWPSANVDVRVQNNVTKVNNVVIDSGTNVTTDASGRMVIPFKHANASNVDWSNFQELRPGDKIVLRSEAIGGIPMTPMGYYKIHDITYGASGGTITVASGITNAAIVSNRFNVDWQIYKITYQHFYPMYSVSQSRFATSPSEFNNNHFALSYIVKDLSSLNGGYYIVPSKVYITVNGGTLTATIDVLNFDYRGFYFNKATAPSDAVTGLTTGYTSDNVTKTYVSALSTVVHPTNGKIYCTWNAVKRTLRGGYGYTEQSHPMAAIFNTGKNITFRNLTVVGGNNSLQTNNAYVTSVVTSVPWAFTLFNSTTTYLTHVFSVRRYGIATIVNGEYLIEDGTYASPNGDDLAVVNMREIEVSAAGNTWYSVAVSDIATNLARDMSARPACRPWLHSGSIYIAMYVGESSSYKSSESTSLVVYDLMTGPSRLMASSIATIPRPVCNLLPRQVFYQNLAGDRYPRFHIQLPSVETTSSGYRFVSTVSNNVSDTGLSRIIDVELKTNDFRTSCQLNGMLLLSGGVPSGFDGSSVYEIGSIRSPVIWHTFPDPKYAGVSESSVATWRYKAVFEWTDNKGNIFRSAPSDAITLRMLENGKLPYGNNAINASPTANPFILQTGDIKIHSTFNHSTLRGVSASNYVETNPIRVVFYRTLKNDDTNYYRVTTMPVVSNLANDASFGEANGFGVDTTRVGNDDPPISLTFTDIYSDTDISDNELLYDLGGSILSNQSPPSASFVCTHKNRAWLAGTPDDSIWYSKTSTSGLETAFNEALTVNAFDGGRVVGMASLDDYLVVFKSNSIWIIQGDGPDQSGNNSTLQTPIRVVEGTGCVSPGSIIVVGDAVYFQSMDGIYRMRRGSNQPELISQPIRDLTVDYFQLYNLRNTDVTYTSVDNSLRFVFAGSYISGGVTYTASYNVILNLTHNVWSSVSTAAVASCEHQSTWYFIHSSNALKRENRNVRYDNGSTLAQRYSGNLRIELLRLAELAGISRVQRIILIGRRTGSNTGGYMTLAFRGMTPMFSQVGTTRYFQGQFETVNGVTLSRGVGYVEHMEFPVVYQKKDNFLVSFGEFAGLDATSKVIGDGENIVITGIVVYGNPLRGKAPKPKSLSRKSSV